MNANELADWLENHVCGRETTKEVITMLRQQQAEIQELKEWLEKVKDAYGKQCSRGNRLSAEVVELKNEVVDLSGQLNIAQWMIGKAQELEQ